MNSPPPPKKGKLFKTKTKTYKFTLKSAQKSKFTKKKAIKGCYKKLIKKENSQKKALHTGNTRPSCTVKSGQKRSKIVKKKPDNTLRNIGEYCQKTVQNCQKTINNSKKLLKLSTTVNNGQYGQLLKQNKNHQKQ